MHISTRWLRVGALFASLSLAVLAGCSITSTKTVINGTPQPSYIFQDALSSNANNWNTDSSCTFGTGGYHIKASFICFAPTDKVTDAVGTVTVKQISGPTDTSFGLVFRHPSTGNYYAFEISAGGKWQFYKVANKQNTTLAPLQANTAIKTGLNVSNTIQVKCVAQNYTFLVNGTQVGQFSDSSFTSAGDWGLDGADGLEVVYSNFSLAKP
ncbi:MAG: hypothetical protein H0X24_05535 [Ktedonobacterales bacterium]|nr:hypothetical protein [Ktedonobacterales bacterium]